MRVDRVRSTLTGHATSPQATALGSSEGRIATAMYAIAWTRSIHAVDLQDNIKSGLLSDRAKETREAIKMAAGEWREIQAAREAAMSQLMEFGVQGICDLPPNDLMRLVDDLSTRRQELADFIVLRRQRRRLDAAGLSEFLAACDNHSVEPSRIPLLFDAIVAERRAAAARRAEGLAANNGALLEARRRAFAERDRAKIVTDRTAVRAKLLQATPPVGAQDGPKKTWTEMRLLGNEFSKVRRFTPVRQLLARAGRAIQTLKPCFMMSPLSLAKFVAAGNLEFDLLVIDEASQMRPEDALGGMLRTKQIVVVGDPKQLPPTDFFARAETSAGAQDDDDDDIDAESILEACEKTFRERRRLKWHYRSRCESLIAFSNREFYDDSLITFPMARPSAFSVELVRVDGTYRARRNPTEAAVVAEEAIEFMRHFAEAPEKDLATLGIVAVNVEQRDFIQEELRRLWADDELVELYREKAEAKGEPLFVKNLENVQGDERDHIFISMTYGRKHGEPALAQYFGPITRKQGHRRLNVLFTRARIRIGLFTSFGSADVRPTETSSDGVKALKAYLEYAETKGRALAHAARGEPDSDFEVEVADRLRMKGYKVDLQVGVSRKEERRQNFRIDLGVRHPDHPERFLAGIECDGAAYHSSKSARDRDRLREEVLKSLGWELVRVWSTDWFDDPALETERLARKLEELRLRPPSAFTSYRPLRDLEAATSATGGDEGLNKVDDATAVRATQDDRAEVGTDAQEQLSPVDQEDAANSVPKVTGAELFSGNGSLTPTEAMSALEAFREQVIRPAFSEWDARRSILRPAMIETFVQQRVVDPDEWHSRIPQYLRVGTNAAEKNRFLDEICEIIERIRELENPGTDGGTRVASVAPPPETITDTAMEGPSTAQTAYAPADLAKVGRPNRELFYDGAYSATLRAMIVHVINAEGPIFEDVLVDRIARAHGMQRSGNQIRRRVVALLPANVSRINEGERTVVWPPNKDAGAIHIFRKDDTGVRGHEDVPLKELAAIALPFIRLRMDDESVLRKMAEQFNLGRLREATRARFEEALGIARRVLFRRTRTQARPRLPVRPDRLRKGSDPAWPRLAPRIGAEPVRSRTRRGTPHRRRSLRLAAGLPGPPWRPLPPSGRTRREARRNGGARSLARGHARRRLSARSRRRRRLTVRRRSRPSTSLSE